jgi:hypothetical protein
VSSGFVSCLDNARSQYNGAMLTYQRLPLEEAVGERVLIVVFLPLPTALAHPAALREIQALNDQVMVD